MQGGSQLLRAHQDFCRQFQCFLQHTVVQHVSAGISLKHPDAGKKSGGYQGIQLLGVGYDALRQLRIDFLGHGGASHCTLLKSLADLPEFFQSRVVNFLRYFVKGVT